MFYSLVYSAVLCVVTCLIQEQAGTINKTVLIPNLDERDTRNTLRSNQGQ